MLIYAYTKIISWNIPTPLKNTIKRDDLKLKYHRKYYNIITNIYD